MILLPKKIGFFLLLLVGLCPFLSPAQVSFSAKIAPSTIGKNETAELRLMVENAGRVEEINPPPLDDFIILSGPNQESGMESINGATRQYIGLTYLLKPKSKGRITIGPATAKADGKTLKSNRVILEVSNASGATSKSNPAASPFSGLSPFYDPVVQSAYEDYILRRGENVAEKIGKNIFIKLEVDKNTCYVSEPVVVTYKLYTRLKSESSIIKNPSFNGFSVIDLVPPGSTHYTIERLNGRDYNVYTLRKAQLYPLQTGNIELESAEVENNIHFIKEEFITNRRNGLDDMFRDFAQTTIPAEGMHDEKVTLQSKPTFITVKPLPAEGKPDLFKGAVGNFTIESSVGKTAFTTDDAGKLRVILSGEGNMTLINAPEVQWPQGIESFDSKARDQLNKYAVPVSGIKVFEYPFSIARAGNYTLPPIQFCFFDVKQHTYKTISTRPFNITVTAGTGNAAVTSGNKNSGDNRGSLFHMIFTNRWLIIVPVFILVITGLFVWSRKENKEVKKVREIEPQADPGPDPLPVVTNFDPLRLSEEQLVRQDAKNFYETLNKEFRKFLSEKLSLPLETINRKKIAEEADKLNIPITTCLQIQQLLDDIEFQLYTPFADQDNMQAMYHTAANIVHSLNTIIR